MPIHGDMEIPDLPIGNDRRRRSPADNRVRAKTDEASTSSRDDHCLSAYVLLDPISTARANRNGDNTILYPDIFYITGNIVKLMAENNWLEMSDD